MNILKPRLDAICRSSDNMFCADCGARGPRWSSVKLGILICPQCAGIHRKVGTHISFVQSITIDKWKLEWVELVEKIGNRISNMYFEASVPEHIKKPAPSDTHNTGGDIIDSVQAAKLEKWIRNKYELKLFVREGTRDPKDLVKDGLDPRLTEPYGQAPPSLARKKSPKKKRDPMTTAELWHSDEIVLSPPESPPPPSVKRGIILPTSFDWKENVFIASWAKAHGVA